MVRRSHHLFTVVCIATALISSGAHTQTTLDAATPFHRFAEDPASDAPYVAVGWEQRIPLHKPTALTFNDVKVSVDADNTFRVGDALDPAKLSPDALGVIIAIDSVWGHTHHYVATTGVANAADLRVSALPRELANVKERRLRTARAWVREVPKFPRVFRSDAITLPQTGARLSFAIGFEDVLEQAGAREFATGTTSEDRATPAVHAHIAVIADGKETEVFAQELRGTTVSENLRRFQPFSVDLAPFAGQTVQVEFQFTQPAKESVAAAFALPVWGNPVIHAASPISAKKNLLLISLDTLRADHLGVYGYTRDTSPRLDAFAAGATVFDDCLSTSSWTTPAHASLFTGLSPILHGAGGPAGFRLRPSVTTLAELARANGFLTAAFTQGHAVGGGLGFAQGFDQYSNGPESGGLPQSDGSAEAIFAQGRRWLDEFGQDPFMLFLHTYEIHAPYRPPKGFEGRFTTQPAGNGMPKKNMSPDDRERIVALYDEGIAYTDHALGGLLDYLRDSGLLDRTNVVIFSDHGEEFWEHGGVEHSFTLYQEQLHVPLIVRLAGAEPPRGRIPQRVILSDVFATSLDLLGIAHTPPRDSISLLPLLSGTSSAYPRTFFRAELYKENLKYFMIAGISQDDKYTARTQYDNPASPLNPFILADVPLAEGELSLLSLLDAATEPHPAVEERVYNLSEDPDEQKSESGQRMQTLRRALLDDLRLSAEEARKSPAGALAPNTLTDSEREQLKALGYVE